MCIRDRIAFELGFLKTDAKLEELRIVSKINEAAAAFVNDDNFSSKVRNYNTRP